jgi:hypothetical protein
VARDLTAAHSRCEWSSVSLPKGPSLCYKESKIRFRSKPPCIHAQHSPCCSWTACCWTSFPDLQQEGNRMMARDGCLDYLGQYQSITQGLHALLGSLCDAGRFR